jgi:hypothetical protein
MQSIDRAPTQPNQVIALFADSALSFSLPNCATFADLADRLQHFCEGHIGMPTTVYLTLGTARQPFPMSLAEG